MAFRNRITGYKEVRAADLYANPKNWREHTDRQASMLRSVLTRIGYATALVVREDADGALVIVDGHLRAGLDPEQMVPVLTTDLTEDEGDEFLLTADPLSHMAEADQQALKALLDSVTARDDGTMAGILNQIRLDYVDLSVDTLPEMNDPSAAWGGMPQYENADLEAFRSIVVHFKDAAAVEAFAAALGIPVSERARFLWYPPVGRDKASDKLVVADGVEP